MGIFSRYEFSFHGLHIFFDINMGGKVNFESVSGQEKIGYVIKDYTAFYFALLNLLFSSVRDGGYPKDYCAHC